MFWDVGKGKIKRRQIFILAEKDKTKFLPGVSQLRGGMATPERNRETRGGADTVRVWGVHRQANSHNDEDNKYNT